MNVFCIVLMNGYYVPCTIMPNKYRIVSYRTNKLFTDRVLGISSIEFRQINPVL